MRKPYQADPCRSPDGPNTPGSADPLGASKRPQPKVTPGLIVMSLSTARLAEIALQLGVPVPVLYSPADAGSACRKLLAILKDSELRKLARELGVAEDGEFVDLYRRLSLLC